MHELAAWRAQRREERLVRQERRSFEGYRQRDGTFGRYVDATVGPRLPNCARPRTTTRALRPDLEPTLHAIAATLDCRTRKMTRDGMIVRDVGLGELGCLAHEQQRLDLRTAHREEGLDGNESDERLALVRAEHDKLEVVERERKRETGETAPLAAALRDELDDLPAFQGLDESEREIIRSVEARPTAVLADVTARAARSRGRTWIYGSRPGSLIKSGDRHLGDRRRRDRPVVRGHVRPHVARNTPGRDLDVGSRRGGRHARALATTPSGLKIQTP